MINTITLSANHLGYGAIALQLQPNKELHLLQSKHGKPNRPAILEALATVAEPFYDLDGNSTARLFADVPTSMQSEARREVLRLKLSSYPNQDPISPPELLFDLHCCLNQKLLKCDSATTLNAIEFDLGLEDNGDKIKSNLLNALAWAIRLTIADQGMGFWYPDLIK